MLSRGCGRSHGVERCVITTQEILGGRTKSLLERSFASSENGCVPHAVIFGCGLRGWIEFCEGETSVIGVRKHQLELFRLREVFHEVVDFGVSGFEFAVVTAIDVITEGFVGVAFENRSI